MNKTKVQNQLKPIQQRALILGVIGIVAGFVGLFLDKAQFFQSYLLGYLFVTGLTLGCFSLLMLHHLVGGSWGFAIRRPLEAGSRMFPLIALLFVPLLFGLEDLYLWARPDEVAHDELLQHKSAYLNVPFFVVRGAIYFVLWIGLAFLLSHWSALQDDNSNPRHLQRIKLVSGLGLGIYGATVTLASVDWVMSLEPHWFSTIYGVIFMVGNALTAFGFMIIVLARLADFRPTADYVEQRHFHDLGNLTLAFVMLWAYLAFSQYLIIWSGNLAEEAHWYVHRTGHSWKTVVVLLMLFHFAVPFMLLLSRNTKRNVRRLSIIAGAMIFMRFVDLFWMVVPAFHHDFHLHWLDLATPIGIGGIWMAAFIWQLEKRPLLPLGDPRFAEAMNHKHAEGNHISTQA